MVVRRLCGCSVHVNETHSAPGRRGVGHRGDARTFVLRDDVKEKEGMGRGVEGLAARDVSVIASGQNGFGSRVSTCHCTCSSAKHEARSTVDACTHVLVCASYAGSLTSSSSQCRSVRCEASNCKRNPTANEEMVGKNTPHQPLRHLTAPNHPLLSIVSSSSSPSPPSSPPRRARGCSTVTRSSLFIVLAASTNRPTSLSDLHAERGTRGRDDGRPGQGACTRTQTDATRRTRRTHRRTHRRRVQPTRDQFNHWPTSHDHR